MIHNLGAILREKTLQHADVKDRIASFETFLDAHAHEMHEAADNGRGGIYIDITTGTCTANDSEIAYMDPEDLRSTARQFGLHIENHERLDSTNIYDRNHVSFDLYWL